MSEQALDARGLICPLPVLKARKALLKLAPGDLLRVTVTDKAAPADFRLFCAESGHVLKSVTEKDGGFEITVEVSACRARG